VDVVALLAAQGPQPLAVVRETLAQAVAKHLLQMGEPVIAQALGEAHQGRRLNPRMLGDPRDGAEGHLLRVLHGEGGELLQPLGHGFAAAEQQGSQAFVILGSGPSDRLRRACPSSALHGSHPQTAIETLTSLRQKWNKNSNE